MNNQFLYLSFVGLLGLAACGGGGGGGGDDSGGGNQASSSSRAPQESSILNRQNTPQIVSSYLDLVLFAKEISASIVQGGYQFTRPDAVYKDECANDGGSLEIQISGFGTSIKQKYNNCTIYVTSESGTKESITISGQEDILVIKEPNRPSTFQLTWNEYSLKVEEAPKLELNGTLKYVGSLEYFIGLDTSSTVTLNITLQSNGEVVTARNLDFIFDFQAIFDRYSSKFSFLSDSYDSRLHIFSGKIEGARGEIVSNNNKATVDMDRTTKALIFSASNNSTAYLKVHSQGFYIQSDENNDNRIDFNTFLSEKEYVELSNFVKNQNSNIYVPRIPESNRELLPDGLWSENGHESLSLSRTSTITLNAQQFFTSKSGALLEYKINGIESSKDWTQIEAGVFQFIFPDSNGTERYALELTAKDAYQNESLPIHLTIIMNDDLADTDLDGILDINDSDIDNDGVTNQFDKFPKNPAESYDVDGDSIGDNADPDRDNDGFENAVDAYPGEYACHTSDKGDGVKCYLTDVKYSFDDGRTIYFSQLVNSENGQDEMRFIKFDTQAMKFLEPSPVFNLSRYHNLSSYNSLHNKVLIQESNDLYILDLTDYSKIMIASMADTQLIPQFSEYGYFVMNVTPYIINWSEVYDHNGNLVDSNQAYVRENMVWHLDTYLKPASAKDFCAYSVSLDAQGKLNINGNLNDREICYPGIEVSPDGIYLLTSLGEQSKFFIFNKQKEEIFASEGRHSTWIGSSILYLDYSLSFIEPEFVVVDFINNLTHRRKMLEPDSWHVVGDKIVAIANGNNNSQPPTSRVYDHELNLVFSY